MLKKRTRHKKIVVFHKLVWPVKEFFQETIDLIFYALSMKLSDFYTKAFVSYLANFGFVKYCQKDVKKCFHLKMAV